MNKNTIVNDEVTVRETTTNHKKIIYVIDRGEKIYLSSATDDQYETHTFNLNANYIVTFVYGSMACPSPLVIKAAYDYKRHKKLDVSNHKISQILENMVAASRGFSIDEVITEINGSDFGIIEERDEGAPILHEYLTSGNDAIPHEAIVNYIYSAYPLLRDYSPFDENIKLLDYRKMCEEVGDWLEFHAMPQLIEPEGTGLKLLYTVNKENE